MTFRSGEHSSRKPWSKVTRATVIHLRILKGNYSNNLGGTGLTSLNVCTKRGKTNFASHTHSV